MVRLFQEGIFSFKLEPGYKSYLVVLDEEFDYRSIRNHLSQNALKDQKSQDVCRAVWEILIIYRVMSAARDQISTSDPTLRAHINEVEVLLGLASQKTNVFDILLSHKKKVGVKFDTFHPNIVGSMRDKTTAIIAASMPAAIKSPAATRTNAAASAAAPAA